MNSNEDFQVLKEFRKPSVLCEIESSIIKMIQAEDCQVAHQMERIGNGICCFKLVKQQKKNSV